MTRVVDNYQAPPGFYISRTGSGILGGWIGLTIEKKNAYLMVLGTYKYQSTYLLICGLFKSSENLGAA